MDFCRTMVKRSFHQTSFRTFLELYTGKSIPMEATLRKVYIDDVFNSTLEDVNMEIQKNKILVLIDM